MKNVILVVDDDKTNLSLAQRILGPQYRIAPEFLNDNLFLE